jgi:two-component system cell cycle sensor histidine kinase/response regulator CckA
MSILNSAGNSSGAVAQQLATARAQLEAERTRVAALALFARRMSHDMSNFVTVVRSYSELLLADLPPASATHADVMEIHRASDAMIAYMQRIARFARATNGLPGAVALDDVVSDLIRTSSENARIAGTVASRATVNIDAMWLSDALREIVANAREASPAGATVRINTWRETLEAPIVDGGMPVDAGVWAVTEIADEGNGFAADGCRAVLDPFVTTKNGVRGAGFGLALARGAVWHAGGQLVLSDRSALPDHAVNEKKPGANVRLWLPVQPD